MSGRARIAGRYLSPEGLTDGALVVSEGRIVELQAGSGDPRRVLLPGFIDLHVHGGGGADVMDGPDAVASLARFHLRHGTTALCPTTVTRPLPELEQVVTQVGRLPDDPRGARLLGVHLEGPFLADSRRGAQPAFCVPPDPQALGRLLAAGPVATVTLAPELPGALELIRLCRARGVRASLGHSSASCEQGQAAFAAGAGGVTHLYNAMRGLTHRDPGLAAAALEAEGAYLELILDNHHVHPALFRLALRAARGKLVLVSDAIRAAGLPPGESELGGQVVRVAEGKATLPDGTLAGSLLTLDAALRNAVQAGLRLEEASALLSLHPAQALGRADLGRLAPGAWADLVELDADDLTLTRVWRGGQEVELG